MIGQRIGRYVVESELGSGAMGSVWAAVTRRAVAGLPRGTRVALKTIHPHLVRSENALARFEREARVGSMVEHPNVVRTFDSGAARLGLIGLGERTPYIAMEFVEGQTLREFLDKRGVVSDALARHVGHDVARGLGAIHAAGALHRDIKPQNVLITPDHVVKIMDLGIALPTGDVRMTQTGAVIGSIPWMAPERLTEAEVNDDTRSDLYAVGVVLYELLSGVHPFMGENRTAVMVNIMQGAARRLGEINPQVSAFLEDAIHTVMATDPDERFADAATLASVLEDGERGLWWRERASAIRRQTERPLRRPRIPRETAVHGRESELDQLRTLFHEAKSGNGRVVLLEGEDGIGKSRLVDELVQRLMADEEEFDFLFGTYAPGGAATISGGVAEAFREHLGETGAEHLLPQLPLLVPGFNALLSGSIPPPGTVVLTPDSLHTCFVQALRALSEVRPVILLVDDLHFAPAVARALFTALAMAVPQHRVLLLGNTRRRGAEHWRGTLTTLEHVTHLPLPRLGTEDLVRMLENCFDSTELADELGRHVTAKSEGNPFFALEIVNGLRDGHFVTRGDDGAWHRTRALDAMEVPSSVVDLIEARVGELDDEDRSLLDVAACCGHEFDATLVADALGAARIPTLQRLARLESRHRLVRASGRRFRFDHSQLQEVLYRALPELLREGYHAALGEALEARAGAAAHDPEELDGEVAAELCRHFASAGRLEPTLRYVTPAWKHLMNQVRHEAVIELLRRTLDLDGAIPADAEAELLMHLDLTLWRSGRLKEAAEVCDRLVDQRRATGTPRELADALAVSAMRQGDMGGQERASELVRDALALVPEDDVPAKLTHAVCRWLVDKGETEEALVRMRRELELANEDGRPERRSAAESTMGTLVRGAGGDFAEVRGHYERGIELARETGYVSGEIGSTINLGYALQTHGEISEAIACFERAADLARRVGHRRGEAITGVNLGVACAALGDNERAATHGERSLELSRETGARRVETYALHQLGALRWNDGDLEEAERLTRGAVELRRSLEYIHLPSSLVQLGGILAEAGRHDEARTCLDEGLELARERGHGRAAAMGASYLAQMPGGSPGAARAEFERFAEGVDDDDRLAIRVALWRATRAREDLEAAYALLERTRDTVPERFRESLLENVRGHRELVAAWAARDRS